MEDKTARLIAIASLVVAIAAAYISYTGSPYFYAQPHQMSYWTLESNSLTDQKIPKNGKLEVHVYNDSTSPARDVLVVVRHQLAGTESDPDDCCGSTTELHPQRQ
jgi:hypothetical protein